MGDDLLFIRPKYCEQNESTLAKLYKVTSLYVRSLWSVLRLLPVYSLRNGKFHLRAEVKRNDFIPSEALKEPFIQESSSQSLFERIESVQIGLLETVHGNLAIEAQFRADVNFSLLPKSTAIAVPKSLPEHEIRIENSPDWIDMTQYTLSREQPKSVSYRPVIVPSNLGKPEGLTEFIKFFEKPPEITWPATEIKNSEILKQLERTRSEKILLDRWLEEQEMAQESKQSLNLDGFLDSME